MGLSRLMYAISSGVSGSGDVPAGYPLIFRMYATALRYIAHGVGAKLAESGDEIRAALRDLLAKYDRAAPQASSGAGEARPGVDYHGVLEAFLEALENIVRAGEDDPNLRYTVDEIHLILAALVAEYRSREPAG